MDALDARRIDPDLAPWDGGRQAGNQRRVELERDRLGRRGGEGVGAHGRLNDGAEQAQNAVVVDPADSLERGVEMGALAVGIARFAGGVVKLGEQRDERFGRVRRAAEGIDDGGESIGYSGLAKVAKPGAEPGDGARVEPGEQDQLVEGVILRRAAQDRGDGFLDHPGVRYQRVEVGPGGQLEEEVVDRPLRAAAERGWQFLEHAESEILEYRDRFAERDEAAEAVGLEVELVCDVAGQADEPGTARILAKVGEAADIGRRFDRAGTQTILFGKKGQIGQREAGRARGADAIGELGLGARRPAADHFNELGVEPGDIGERGVGGHRQRVADQGKLAVAELDRPAGDVRADRLFDDLRQRQAAPRRQLVARQPDENKEVAAKRVGQE